MHFNNPYALSLAYLLAAIVDSLALTSKIFDFFAEKVIAYRIYFW